MNKRIVKLQAMLALLFLVKTIIAAPPSQDDVNVYSSLCNIGKLKDYELGLEKGHIGQYLSTGEKKLSEKDLQQKFPGIRNERNRLLALEAYQDCMYQYISRFHPEIFSNDIIEKQNINTVLSPSVPTERKREIVFLANALENFKAQMSNMKSVLPERYYDKRNSKEAFPKKDSRVLDIDNYNRYKAFQTPSGIPNFSNMTNSDIVLLCDTFNSEVVSYSGFQRDYRKAFNLSSYRLSPEVNRICRASKQGR